MEGAAAAAALFNVTARRVRGHGRCQAGCRRRGRKSTESTRSRGGARCRESCLQWGGLGLGYIEANGKVQLL